MPCSPSTDTQTDRHTRKWLQRAPFQGFRIFSFNLSSRIGPKKRFKTRFDLQISRVQMLTMCVWVWVPVGIGSNMRVECWYWQRVSGVSQYQYCAISVLKFDLEARRCAFHLLYSNSHTLTGTPCTLYWGSLARFKSAIVNVFVFIKLLAQSMLVLRYFMLWPNPMINIIYAMSLLIHCFVKINSE